MFYRVKNYGGSSSGRTGDSGSLGPGSIPGPPVKKSSAIGAALFFVMPEKYLPWFNTPLTLLISTRTPDLPGSVLFWVQVLYFGTKEL